MKTDKSLNSNELNPELLHAEAMGIEALTPDDKAQLPKEGTLLLNKTAAKSDTFGADFRTKIVQTFTSGDNHSWVYFGGKWRKFSSDRLDGKHALVMAAIEARDSNSEVYIITDNKDEIYAMYVF